MLSLGFFRLAIHYFTLHHHNLSHNVLRMLYKCWFDLGPPSATPPNIKPTLVWNIITSISMTAHFLTFSSLPPPPPSYRVTTPQHSFAGASLSPLTSSAAY